MASASWLPTIAHTLWCVGMDVGRRRGVRVFKGRRWRRLDHSSFCSLRAAVIHLWALERKRSAWLGLWLSPLGVCERGDGDGDGDGNGDD